MTLVILNDDFRQVWEMMLITILGGLLSLSGKPRKFKSADIFQKGLISTVYLQPHQITVIMSAELSFFDKLAYTTSETF